MDLKQYAAEHIIENGKHYPEKWVNRYFIEAADAQRALDAERELSDALAENARQYELELDGDPQNLHGQGRTFGLRSQLATLQARNKELDRTLADVYQQRDGLQAQLQQVEGQSKQQAEEAVIVFAKYTALRQLVAQLPVVDGRMDVECGACYYIRSFVAGQYGIVCGLMTEQYTAMAIKALLEYRATLAAKDAGKEDVSHD